MNFFDYAFLAEVINQEISASSGKNWDAMQHGINKRRQTLKMARG